MKTLSNYEIVSKLGQGSYGQVFKAFDKKNKSYRVIKKIPLSKLSQRAKQNAINQARLLNKIEGPYIVKYFQSFQEGGYLNIVMEYCQGGDMSSYLRNQFGRPLKQEKIWKFLLQLAIALRYIHGLNVLHRDIKAMNIFLTKDQQIRVGDLGVAKLMDGKNFAHTMVGTPFYISPQMCQQKPYNSKSDIWSLGCVLYQMCTFKHPFQAKNQGALILKIIRGKYNPISTNYSNGLKQILDGLLERDYKKRLSAQGILKHPFSSERLQQINIKQAQSLPKQKKKQQALQNKPEKQVQKDLKQKVVNKDNRIKKQQRKPSPTKQKRFQTPLQKKIAKSQSSQKPLQSVKAVRSQAFEIFSNPTPIPTKQKQVPKKQILQRKKSIQVNKLNQKIIVYKNIFSQQISQAKLPPTKSNIELNPVVLPSKINLQKPTSIHKKPLKPPLIQRPSLRKAKQIFEIQKKLQQKNLKEVSQLPDFPVKLQKKQKQQLPQTSYSKAPLSAAVRIRKIERVFESQQSSQDQQPMAQPPPQKQPIAQPPLQQQPIPVNSMQQKKDETENKIQQQKQETQMKGIQNKSKLDLLNTIKIQEQLQRIDLELKQAELLDYQLDQYWNQEQQAHLRQDQNQQLIENYNSLVSRENELNSLLNRKVSQCEKLFGVSAFNITIHFVRQMLNKQEQYTQQDEQEIQNLVRSKLGKWSPQRIYDLYKVMHLQIELENVRRDLVALAQRMQL